MGIRVVCPGCGKEGIAPDNVAGRLIRCRGCRTEFPVGPGPVEEPAMRVIAETHPGAALPDMADLSLLVRARRFLKRPVPPDLDDHSMGLGLIRAYAAGDEDKLRDKNYLKVLKTFLIVLRLGGKGGSPECREYTAEEVRILQDIQAELGG